MLKIIRFEMQFLVSCLLIFSGYGENKKSISCEIGNRLGEECSLNTYNSNITELKLFKECTDHNHDHKTAFIIIDFAM